MSNKQQHCDDASSIYDSSCTVSDSDSVTSSDHASMAARLTYQGLEAEYVSRAMRFDIDEFFQFFHGLQTEHDGTHLTEKLKAAFGESYRDESSFSSSLLATLRSCINAEACGVHHIILTQEHQVGKKGNKEFAIGFASKVTQTQLGFIADTVRSNGPPRHDHSCVIYERTNKGNGEMTEWTVCDIVASVELKMDNNNCQKFNVDDFGNVKTTSIDLADEYGALGQAIAYVMSNVIRCRARLGLKLVDVPFAVVAARKKDYDGNKCICWVRGNLLVPEKCGERFYYNVDDFGEFSDTDYASAAMAAYLHVMTDGLTAAHLALKNLTMTSEDGVRTTSVSGQKLYFGDAHLGMMILSASPVPAAASVTSSKKTCSTAITSQNKTEGTEQKMLISQGELYSGAIQLETLVSRTSRGVYWCIDHRIDNAERKVLVKVTSRACHKLFTPTEWSFLWSAESGDVKWENCRSVLSASLYGVYRPSKYGLIQLMPDLREEGFKVLRPCNEIGKLNRVWSAYDDLVRNVLIPLADDNLVHPDIRPGYKYTANILYCDNGEDDKPQMRLIDLDTICEGTSMLEKRFLMGKNESRCYVFWQVVAMACYWKFRTLDGTSPIEVMKVFIPNGGQKRSTFGISKEWHDRIKEIVARKDQKAQLDKVMAFFANAFTND